MDLISKSLIKKHFCHCFFDKPTNEYDAGFQNGVRSVLAFLDANNENSNNNDIYDFDTPLELEDLEAMCDRSCENKPIWIKLLQIGMTTPGFIDFINGSIVGVWCASNNSADGWLYAKDYGETWLAYESEPI